MAQSARKQVEVLPAPTSAPQPAPGVVYAENAIAPGLKFFRCDAYRASLSMPGCASRWRESQVAIGEAADKFAACRGCPIGALHAGYAPIRYSRHYGLSICPRHGGGTTRMIGNRRCVSCYNREREMDAGKNARGNAPVELMERPLHTLEIRLVIDGVTRRLRDRKTSGLAETMIQALRTTKGELEFGFAGPDRLLRQRRLF